MRYSRSLGPNDASEWSDEIQFGESCTYPTLVCGPDDTLYFTCRRQLDDTPWQVELWTKRPDQPWQNAGPILKARYKGYAHFLESLAWSPDHQTLYLSCRFHEKTDGKAYGRLQTLGFMKSRDFGKTWMRSDTSPIQMPATAGTIEVLESGGLEKDKILRAGAMAVDANGLPHLVYSIQENGKGKSILASPENEKDGVWKRITLNSFLPEKFKEWDLIMPGGISFNDRNKMFVVAQVQKPGPEESSWGHPSNEKFTRCQKGPAGGLYTGVVEEGSAVHGGRRLMMRSLQEDGLNAKYTISHLLIIVDFAKKHC